MPAELPDLFRRDQKDGISAPDLADSSSYAEHVVHARGKRTRFTSVSESPDAIRDFGDQLWKALRDALKKDGHPVVEHDALVKLLRGVLAGGSPDESERAARALPRTRKRLEALIEWHFNTSAVARKDLVGWATAKVRPYFSKAK